jgi:RNA polymerase sigma-70 factor, ECF subfamily
VVAGEAILSHTASIDRSQAEGSRAEAVDLIESLVREHSRMVYRIAYAVLRSHHDAEDATQDTFLRVLRYSAKLAQVEDSKPWVARIAWRVAVERMRRTRCMREVTPDDSEKPMTEPVARDAPVDDVLHGIQVGSVLEKLIAALPDKLREPLILSTIEEMAPREIAVTLSISEAAVRSRVFRARQILKEKLSQCDDRESR